MISRIPLRRSKDLIRKCLTSDVRAFVLGVAGGVRFDISFGEIPSLREVSFPKFSFGISVPRPKIVRSLRNLFAGLRDVVGLLVKVSGGGEGGSLSISATVSLKCLKFIRTHFLTFSPTRPSGGSLRATGQVVLFAAPVVKIVQRINCLRTVTASLSANIIRKT